MSKRQNLVGILLASTVIFICVALIMLLKPNEAHSKNEKQNDVKSASSMASTTMPIMVGNPRSEQVQVDTTDNTDYNKLVYGENKDMTDSASGVNLDGTVNMPTEYHDTASDFSIQPQNPKTDMANQLIDSTKPTPATVKAVN